MTVKRGNFNKKRFIFTHNNVSTKYSVIITEFACMGHSQIEEHICVFSVPAVHMASHTKIIIVCVFVLSTNIDEHVLFIMRQLLM